MCTDELHVNFLAGQIPALQVRKTVQGEGLAHSPRISHTQSTLVPPGFMGLGPKPESVTSNLCPTIAPVQ